MNQNEYFFFFFAAQALTFFPQPSLQILPPRLCPSLLSYCCCPLPILFSVCPKRSSCLNPHPPDHSKMVCAKSLLLKLLTPSKKKKKCQWFAFKDQRFNKALSLSRQTGNRYLLNIYWVLNTIISSSIQDP